MARGHAEVIVDALEYADACAARCQRPLRTRVMASEPYTADAPPVTISTDPMSAGGITFRSGRHPLSHPRGAARRPGLACAGCRLVRAGTSRGMLFSVVSTVVNTPTGERDCGQRGGRARRAEIGARDARTSDDDFLESGGSSAAEPPQDGRCRIGRGRDVPGTSCVHHPPRIAASPRALRIAVERESPRRQPARGIPLS